MAPKILRPSSILFAGFVLIAVCGTSMRVYGNPLPQDGDGIKKDVTDAVNDASSKVQDFFQRAKNTFTLKADKE